MATLEEVFQEQKAWIADCDDPDAILDRISEWQDAERSAARDGNQLVRMRAGDLVKLARQRVVRLKAEEIKAEEARSNPAKPANRTEAPERSRAAAVETTHDDTADEVAKLRADLDASRAAQRKAERERAAADALAVQRSGEAAAARRAADEAKKTLADQRNVAASSGPAPQQAAAPASAVGAARPSGGTTAAPVRTGTVAAGPAQVAATRVTGPVKQSLDLRRVQADAPAPRAHSTQPASRTTTTAAAGPPVAAAPRSNPPVTQSDLARAIGDAVVAKLAGKPPTHDLAKSDREALESAGRFPIPGPKNPTGPWRPDNEWPDEWTLTGFDLAIFRGRIRVTQKVLAGQLGVEQGTISKAEAAVKARLGPTLQVALRKAIDDLNKSPDRPRREGA